MPKSRSGGSGQKAWVAALVLTCVSFTAALPAHADDPFCERIGVRCAPRGIHRSLWFVTAETATVQFGAVLALSLLPGDTTAWGPGSITNVWTFAQQGFHLDNDHWYFNYVGHPLAGSEYYLLARNRGGSWTTSLTYAFAMSAVWELVTEGFYEQASIQDLLITPIGGAVLGELRWQLIQALIEPRTGEPRSLGAQILIVLLDPFDALLRAIDSLGGA
jgi:hypothetical protein